jgi:hypothetical protein
MPVSFRGPLAGALLLAALACGPNEPPAIQDWMLGVFSSAPGDSDVTEQSQIQQYHVDADGSFEKISISVNGFGARVERTWEPTAADQFVVYPGDADEGMSPALRWLVRRTDDCQFVDVEEVRQNGSIDAGWYRGATCVRAADPCEPEDAECPGYELYWCDGAPEPCEDAEGE